MLPFRAAVLFCLHSNGAISGCRISMYLFESYVGCTSSRRSWKRTQVIAPLATMCAEEGGKQLSAFPGNRLTSSVTDSRDMANDGLDCSDHRYDEHENHQQGSNNGT
jgi:hypothetical protein